jgi:hypothetical protein
MENHTQIVLATIDEYIDAAKVANDIKSDRELCRFLKFKGQAVFFWRAKKAWPSDESMLKLAKAANQDDELALAQLGIWRNKGAVKKTWKNIATRIAGVAFSLLIASSAMLMSGGGFAQKTAWTLAEHGNQIVANTVYYGKYAYTV